MGSSIWSSSSKSTSAQFKMKIFVLASLFVLSVVAEPEAEADPALLYTGHYPYTYGTYGHHYPYVYTVPKTVVTKTAEETADAKVATPLVTYAHPWTPYHYPYALPKVTTEVDEAKKTPVVTFPYTYGIPHAYTYGYGTYAHHYPYTYGTYAHYPYAYYG